MKEGRKLMMEKESKNKKLEKIEIFYLCAVGAVLLGMILPWISIPLLGSFSALKSSFGVVAFFIVAISGGLFFWRKNLSQSILFVLSGLFILFVIERVVVLGLNGFALDFGFLGEISIFNFLGIGVYITILASASLFVLSLLLLKKENIKYLKIASIVLGSLFVIGLIYGSTSGFYSNMSSIEGDEDNGSLLNDVKNNFTESESEDKYTEDSDSKSANDGYLECYSDDDCSSKEKCVENECVSKEEKPKGPGYSRSDPAQINTSLTTNFGYSWDRTIKARVTLLNVQRGESAWNKVKEANMFNEEPEEGKEYLLTKFKFEVLNTSDSKSYELSTYEFEAVSSDGVVYDSSYASAPEPSLSKEIYPGGSHKGWVVFEVNKNDSEPLVVFKKDSDEGLWFSLK